MKLQKAKLTNSIYKGVLLILSASIFTGCSMFINYKKISREEKSISFCNCTLDTCAVRAVKYAKKVNYRTKGKEIIKLHRGNEFVILLEDTNYRKSHIRFLEFFKDTVGLALYTSPDAIHKRNSTNSYLLPDGSGYFVYDSATCKLKSVRFTQ